MAIIPPKDPNPAASSGGDPITGTDYNNIIDWIGSGSGGHRHTGINNSGSKISHEDLISVTADQHHNRLHTLSDTLDHSGSITDAQHGTRGSSLHTDSHVRLHAISSTSDHSGTLLESQLPTGAYVRKFTNSAITTGSTSADPATSKTYTPSLSIGELYEAHAVVDINRNKARINATDEVLFELFIEGAIVDSVLLRYDATGAGDIFCLGGALFGSYTILAAGSVTFKVKVTVVVGSTLWRVKSFSVYKVIGTGGGGLGKE